MSPLAAAIRELLVQAIADTGSVPKALSLLHDLVDAAGAPEEPVAAYSKPDADGLITIREMQAFRRTLLDANNEYLYRLAELMVPERIACKAGLDQLPEGSDLWHIVRTEMAWAALGENNQPFGNPEEIARVNTYRVHEEHSLLWRRLERVPFVYIPRALAFSSKFATAESVVAEVKRRVRKAVSESQNPTAPGVDFSPLPPLP